MFEPDTGKAHLFAFFPMVRMPPSQSGRQCTLTVGLFSRRLRRWTSMRAPASTVFQIPDMLHAYRHHWRAFETDDPAVTMLVGPSTTGEPLEIGIVVDDDGAAIIHAMQARPKFLSGWWHQ